MIKLQFPKRRDVITAVCLYTLNIFDMIATMFAVGRGYAVEINPLMRMLMKHGMGYFVFTKVFVMLVLTVFLLFLPFSRRVNTTLLFLAGMYAMLGIMHILIFLSEHGN